MKHIKHVSVMKAQSSDCSVDDLLGAAQAISTDPSGGLDCLGMILSQLIGGQKPTKPTTT